MSIYLGDLELATGGGATNTGLPVNTYESFYVSATGNPTGYDATTGLYTHPNGDQWLKTGNNISGDFPDASIAQPATFTATGDAPAISYSSNYTPVRNVAQDDNYWYFYSWRSGNTIKHNTRVTKALPHTSVGGEITWFTNPFGKAQGAVSNDGTMYAFACPEIENNIQIRQTNWSQYTPGTLLYTVTTGWGSVEPPLIVFDVAPFLWAARGSALQRWNYVTNTLDRSLTVAGFNFDQDYYLSYKEGESFVYTSESPSRAVYKIDLTTGASTLYANTSNIGIDYNNPTVGFRTDTSSPYSFPIYSYNAPLVGDGTPRTDTDSGQPLFIRIK